jgi:hypothetical protein
MFKRKRGLVFDTAETKHVFPFGASTFAMACFHFAKFAFHHGGPVGLGHGLEADRVFQS